MFVRLRDGRIVNTQAIGFVEESPDGGARVHVGGQTLEIDAEDWKRLWQATVEPALQSTLELLRSREVKTRALAIAALGELQEPRAVSALLPWLGNLEPAGDTTFSELAASSLRRLGQDEVVEAFEQALAGDVDRTRKLAFNEQHEVTEALLRVLDSNKAAVLAAAKSLAELGAISALPKLHEKTSLFRFPTTQMAQEWSEAVTKLERQAALPRPAEAKDAAVELLPRSVGTSEETISVG